MCIMEKSKASIRLRVKKMRSSIAFYRNIGFKIPHDINTDSPLYIDNDDSDFELVLIPEDQDVDFLIEEFELIQINYPDITAVDSAYKKAASGGCKIITKPWNTFWGTRAAKISDPDGHNILLFTDIV